MDVEMTGADAPPPASSTSLPTGDPESPLLRLPLELLLRISYYLTTTELGQLRLSCGHIEKSLFPSFAREFFKHKQFNLTEFSLQALLAISRSRMAGAVRHLHIGVESISHARTCHTHRSPAATFRHNQLHTHQWILMTTGQDAVMLAEALRGLTNLEDVLLRDVNSTRRSRDGPSAAWNSYGDMTFRQQTGARLTNAAVSYDEYASYKVFIKTLQALAAADSKVSGIELLLRKHGVPWRGTFYVPEYLQPTMLPVLSRLRKLHLTIGDDYRALSEGDAFNARTWSFELRQFLSYVPNLRDFRFNGFWGDTSVFDLFMEWLAMDAGAAMTCPESIQANPEERAIIESSPLPVGFPHLAKFSLGRIHVKPDMLTRLVAKFAPTLVDLALWDMTMAAADQQELDVWRRFWRGLAALPGLELRHIKVGRQKFEDGQHKLPAVRFAGGRNEAEYEGPDWRGFVKDSLENPEIERFGTWQQQRQKPPLNFW